MSRLDWFTIAVVGICILAIIFLLAKTTSLLAGEQQKPTTHSEIIDEMGLNDDETIDPANFENESEGEEGESDSGTAASDNEATTDGEGGSGDDSTADEEEDDSEGEEIAAAGSESSSSEGSSASSRSVAPPLGAGGDFMVIAGSFSIMENAEKFAGELQSKGYGEARVHKFNKGKFASVIVDRFEDSASASELVKELKAKGIESYLQRKKGNN